MVSSKGFKGAVWIYYKNLDNRIDLSDSTAVEHFR
jgi:hypothetical protein